MNRIYRLVWSRSRAAWCVASELTSRVGKSGHRGAGAGRPFKQALSLLALSVGLAVSGMAGAVAGNPGLYVNDSTDTGCNFMHDTGLAGEMGWKYDGNNAKCLSDDKSTQTGRVLFYGTGVQKDGTNSLTLGNELFVNGGRIGLNNKIDGSNSMAIGNVNETDGTRASGTNAIAIGNNTQSLSEGASAFGTGAKVGSDSSQGLAVGNNALVQGSKGVAIGNGAQTLSNDALTLGNGATVNRGATDSLALGNNSQVAADANKATALGYGANAQASRSTALGESSVAGAANSVALGSGSAVNGIGSTGSVALGQGSSVTGANSVALGFGSIVSKSNSVAIGRQASATSSDAVALGREASAAASDSVALGRGASTAAGTSDSLALGRGASASTTNSVALGANSSTAADLNRQAYMAGGYPPMGRATGEVSVGAFNAERRITNLAAGADDTDAVNVSQLRGVSERAEQLSQDALLWDWGSNSFSATHHGNGPNKITNVAAGDINDNSTDAVNGSQLSATNTQVTNLGGRVTHVEGDVSNLGDHVENIYNTGTKYFHANSTGTDSAALGQDSVAIGMGAVSSHDGSVALGAGSVADGSTLGHQAYLVGGTATGEVNVGNRRVTGVAAGADETDAVNVSQLKGVSDRTDQLSQDALLWDPTANGGNGAFSANHGGRGPNKITNVAAGDVNATSTDAVNGSQLYEVTTQINNITLGGIKYFHANSQKPDSVASGTDSIAVGPAAQASGTSSLAMGDGANASASNASAIGSNAAASGEGATAVGTGTSATGSSSVAMGEGAAATGERSSAIGAGASAEATNSVALGADSVADRDNSVSVGSAGNERQITNVKAGEAATDAVNVSQLRDHGDTINSTINNVDNRVTQAKTDITRLQNGTDGMFQVNNSSNLPKPRPTGTDAVAGGAGAEASGNNSAAIGTRARASGANAAALGNGSSAQAQNSVALGANSVADRANSVSVGSAGNERQITNLAAGTAPTDAVNVSQLQQSMGDISNQFYDYTDSRYNALRHDLKKQDDILSAGIAGAMAMATLPQPHSAGASMATVGLGNYRGQGALAIGVSRISDNGKWVTKLQGSTSSQGEAGVAVGLGYQW
jgi:autotransporter adhesin